MDVSRQSVVLEVNCLAAEVHRGGVECACGGQAPRAQSGMAELHLRTLFLPGESQPWTAGSSRTLKGGRGSIGYSI